MHSMQALRLRVGTAIRHSFPASTVWPDDAGHLRIITDEEDEEEQELYFVWRLQCGSHLTAYCRLKTLVSLLAFVASSAYHSILVTC